MGGLVFFQIVVFLKRLIYEKTQMDHKTLDIKWIFFTWADQIHSEQLVKNISNK